MRVYLESSLEPRKGVGSTLSCLQMFGTATGPWRGARWGCVAEPSSKILTLPYVLNCKGFRVMLFKYASSFVWAAA